MRRRGAVRTLVAFVDAAEEDDVRDHALRAVQNLACEGAISSLHSSKHAGPYDLTTARYRPDEGAEEAVRAGVLERLPAWLRHWSIRNARVLAGIFTNIAAARARAAFPRPRLNRDRFTPRPLLPLQLPRVGRPSRPAPLPQMQPLPPP